MAAPLCEHPRLSLFHAILEHMAERDFSSSAFTESSPSPRFRCDGERTDCNGIDERMAPPENRVDSSRLIPHASSHGGEVVEFTNRATSCAPSDGPYGNLVVARHKRKRDAVAATTESLQVLACGSADLAEAAVGGGTISGAVRVPPPLALQQHHQHQRYQRLSESPIRSRCLSPLAKNNSTSNSASRVLASPAVSGLNSRVAARGALRATNLSSSAAQKLLSPSAAVENPFSSNMRRAFAGGAPMRAIRQPTLDLSVVPPLSIPGRDSFPSPSAATASVSAQPSPVSQLARVSAMFASPTPSPSGTPRNDSFRRLRRSGFSASASASSTPSPRGSAVSRPLMSAGDMLRLLSPTVATAANLGSCTIGGPYACPTCFLKFPSLHALGYHENARHGRGGGGGGGSSSGGMAGQEQAGAGGDVGMGILPAGGALRRSSRYFQQPLGAAYSEVEELGSGGCDPRYRGSYTDRNVRARACSEGAANDREVARLAMAGVTEDKTQREQSRKDAGEEKKARRNGGVRKGRCAEGSETEQQGRRGGASFDLNTAAEAEENADEEMGVEGMGISGNGDANGSTAAASTMPLDSLSAIAAAATAAATAALATSASFRRQLLEGQTSTCVQSGSGTGFLSSPMQGGSNSFPAPMCTAKGAWLVCDQPAAPSTQEDPQESDMDLDLRL